jgi:hypothetical protein
MLILLLDHFLQAINHPGFCELERKKTPPSPPSMKQLRLNSGSGCQQLVIHKVGSQGHDWHRLYGTMSSMRPAQVKCG